MLINSDVVNDRKNKGMYQAGGRGAVHRRSRFVEKVAGPRAKAHVSLGGRYHRDS